MLTYSGNVPLGGNVTASSGIVTARGFKSATFSANTTIFVDPHQWQ